MYRKGVSKFLVPVSIIRMQVGILKVGTLVKEHREKLSQMMQLKNPNNYPRVFSTI